MTQWSSFLLYQFLKSHPKVVAKQPSQLHEIKTLIHEFYTQFLSSDRNTKTIVPSSNALRLSSSNVPRSPSEISLQSTPSTPSIQRSENGDNERVESDTADDLDSHSKKWNTNSSYFPSLVEKEFILKLFGQDLKVHDLNAILSESRAESRYSRMQSSLGDNIETSHEVGMSSPFPLSMSQRLSISQSRAIQAYMRAYIQESLKNQSYSPITNLKQLVQVKNTLWAEMKGMKRSQFHYHLRQALSTLKLSESIMSSREEACIQALSIPQDKIVDSIQAIKLFLTQNAGHLISKEAKDSLQQELGVSREWLNATLRRYSMKRGDFSKETKLIFRKWINDKKRLPLSTEDRDEVSRLTGWNKDQISRVVYRAKRRKTLPKLVKNIQQYIRDLPIGSTPTSEDSLLQLSRKFNTEVNTIIHAMKANKAQEPKGKMTQEKKDYVKRWFEESGRKSPTREKFQFLKMKVNWSSQQLSAFLYNLKSNPTQRQTVNKQSKAILREWMQAHNFREPSEVEKIQLLKATGWSKIQLNHQLWLMRDPPGEITLQQKEMMSKWLIEHGKPNAHQKKLFQEMTGWSRKQLNYQLRKLSAQINL